MNLLRSSILTLIFTMFFSVPVVSQAPAVPLNEMTVGQLVDQLHIMQAQLDGTREVPMIIKLNVQIEEVTELITDKNVELLKANGKAFENLTPEFMEATQELHSLSYQKWCHVTLWRAVRGYKLPAWCNK